MRYVRRYDDQGNLTPAGAELLAYLEEEERGKDYVTKRRRCYKCMDVHWCRYERRKDLP